MNALSSILASSHTGDTSDRLNNRERMAKVCKVLRDVGGNYSTPEKVLSALKLMTEWFAEVSMGTKSVFGDESGQAIRDAAAELLLSVLVVDTLGPVFDQQFKNIATANSEAAVAAEQHLIFRGVGVLGELEALQSQVAELLSAFARGVPMGITQRVQIAAGAIAAADLFTNVSAFAAALQARTVVLREFGLELTKALTTLQGAFGTVRNAAPGALKAEKITEFIGVN